MKRWKLGAFLCLFVIGPISFAQGSEVTGESITVKRVTPEDAKDIKDIKPPVAIRPDVSKYLWPALLLGAAILIAISLIAYFKRKKEASGEIEDTFPPRPPDEIAYEELARIASSCLMEQGLIKEYYSQISEVIRRYIEGRYRIEAMELTTSRVIEQISTREIAEMDVNLINSFLQECDLVKFAKFIPPQSEVEELMQRAKEIVSRTREIKGLSSD